MRFDEKNYQVGSEQEQLVEKKTRYIIAGNSLLTAISRISSKIGNGNKTYHVGSEQEQRGPVVLGIADNVLQ